jgi:putative transcriptional regulator
MACVGVIEMANLPFDNQIKTFRFLAGEMTQGDLGDKVGVTRQTIAAIEQGKYSPSLEVAFRIARVFGKPLEEVFRWAEQ